jgi:His/Glu/Gln/Arg/opine family amino acid ABC transporter permease subunit
MGSVISNLRISYEDFQQRYAHLPWFRRYPFLVASLIALLGYTFLLLPPFGRPETFGGWLTVVFYYALIFAWVIIVLSDREKPILLKRMASLSLVVISGWLFYMYSGTKWDRIQDRFLNLAMMDGVWDMYLEGLITTVKVSVVSAIFALSLGMVLGILRFLRNPVLELFLITYIDFFRSMPLIVLMMLVFYALPFIGIKMDAFAAATTALTLLYSAYLAEVIRAGIEAINRGQLDASKVLGLSSAQMMRLVVLPQAVRIIIPPMTSSMVSILKDSAVAYIVTLPELLTMANQAMVTKLNPTPLIMSSIIYLAILLPLTRYANFLETRSKKWIKRSR